jgi:hypothetical protein
VHLLWGRQGMILHGNIVSGVVTSPTGHLVWSRHLTSTPPIRDSVYFRHAPILNQEKAGFMLPVSFGPRQ